MKISSRLLLSFCLALFLLSRADAQPAPPPGDRIVILISIDAFRWDYLQKFRAPCLAKLAAEGVHAEKMISMFPSMTFPNHLTMLTGLRPEHHGMIHNTMYDPVFKARFAYNKVDLSDSRWWGGEPIWATAIKQGRRADCMYWPGTGVTMAGLLPTEFKPYDNEADPNGCVDPVLTWLDQPPEKRPNLIITYFHHVDTASHKFGIESPQVATAVAQVDTAICRLMDGIHQRKLDRVVNLVIVSDHGMVDLSPERVIELRDYVDMDKIQVDFSGAIAGLRPLDDNIDALYQKFAGKENHFHVYRRENMPARYHFTDNRRIPPVIIVADDSWYIGKRAAGEAPVKNMNKATHGFDPELASMGATFIAHGSAFRQHVTIKPFENVHIYNLLCATLSLKPAPNDGDNRLAEEVLEK
jgi:predicted AlkP superfamily pyrophosphatase or phosphodiesterase